MPKTKELFWDLVTGKDANSYDSLWVNNRKGRMRIEFVHPMWNNRTLGVAISPDRDGPWEVDREPVLWVHHWRAPFRRTRLDRKTRIGHRWHFDRYREEIPEFWALALACLEPERPVPLAQPDPGLFAALVDWVIERAPEIPAFPPHFARRFLAALTT